VPHLGAAAEHLYVFQRTPSSIDVRANRPTDPQWAQSLVPGWHQQRMDNFNILVTGGFQEEDLVSDGWTDIIRKLLVMVRKDEGGAVSRDGIAKTMELADFQKMEQIRARVDAIVRDPRTAEALKPYYRQFCKRPCVHNEYLETFNRPNVTLVDTSGHGVERITGKGVVVDGREYPVDCLIYATGFEVGTDYCRRAGLEIHGRGGERLSERWASGTRTLHGMHVHGFPNCFLMNNVQAGFTANYPHLLNEQAKHLAYIVRRGLDTKAASIEVSQEAEQAWLQECIAKARAAGDFLENCTPGYYNNEGKPGERGAQDGFYGGGSPEYFRILEAWRADGSLPGMTIERDDGAAH
jgi:cyclohexanone monooxygenase